MSPVEAKTGEDPPRLLLAQADDQVAADLGHGVHVVEDDSAAPEAEFTFIERDKLFQPEILRFHDSVPLRWKSAALITVSPSVVVLEDVLDEPSDRVND